MITLVIRGSTGVVCWVRSPRDRYTCLRDNFQVVRPDSSQQIDAMLGQIASHSVSLVGQIQQVAQLDL